MWFRKNSSVYPFIISLIFSCSSALAGEFNSTFNMKAGPAIVCFTPGGGCAQIIINELQKAKESILVQAYSFTSAPIAEALVDAFKRGVRVEVILDKSQKMERYSSTKFLSNRGIPTYIDCEHAIAHNKIMIIDGATLITGSFNFTKAAQERNAENLLILHDLTTIAFYTKNWTVHRRHSELSRGSNRRIRKIKNDVRGSGSKEGERFYGVGKQQE